jgi:hypothetical protein
MRWLLPLMLIIFSASLYAKTPNWDKVYKSIQADIDLVEKTKIKDLGLAIRLFELYGEQFFLLIEKENEYKLKVLDSNKYDKPLKAIVVKKNRVLNKLNGLAKKLIGKIKNPETIARIYYTLGLHSYNLKKHDAFVSNFLKANKTAKSEKLRRDIQVKLAEHYFNNKDYKKALFFYNKVVKLPRDEWIVKHIFNRSWCLLKLNKYKAALNEILRSYKIYETGNQINLGKQHVDSIMLIFAFNKKTKAGLDFLRSKRKDSFDNLMLYLHYTFEHGIKKQAKVVINYIDRKKLTPDQYTQLLSKKILIYRTTKQYSSLRKVIAEAERATKKGRLSKKQIAELINAIEGFTGFLQEKIRARNFLQSKNRTAYLNLVDQNFNSLMRINPTKKLYYSWMKGETYLSMGDYKTAVNRYRDSIELAKTMKKKKQAVDKVQLDKIFQAYFKALQELEDESGGQNSKPLIYGYENYLKFFPKSKLASQVYTRYMNLVIKSSGDDAALDLLSQYNKVFPRKIKEQQGYFKGMINRQIKSANIPKLIEYKKMLADNFLGMKKGDYLKLSKTINQLYFKEYEDYEKKKEFDKALEGYEKIYNNQKIDRELRKISLQKILKLYDGQDFARIPRWINTYMDFLTTKEWPQEKKRLEYFLQKLCTTADYSSCEQGIKKYAGNTKNAPKVFYSFMFEAMLLQGKFDQGTKFLIKYQKRLPRENFNQLKLSLINSLILLEKKQMIRSLKDLYKLPLFKKEVKGLLNAYALNQYYTFDDDTLLKDPELPFLKAKAVKLAKSKKMIGYLKNYKMPQFTDKEIQFEAFSQSLMNFSQNTNNYIANVDKYFKSGDPRLGYQVYDAAIKYLQKVSDYLKSYFPKSKEPELQKAVKGELVKISKIYDSKWREYVTLKTQLYYKLNDTYGSHRKYYRIRTELPWTDSLVIQTGY